MEQSKILFNYEYEEKLKVCFIGAGQHSYRNVYPTFQYAPVHLAAVCDIDEGKAAAFARQFGADAYYTDHLEMFEKEKPDAVFIVTAYHPDGRVQATGIALDALRAGIHVWMEKPTAATVDEVRELIQARDESGKFIMTGLKKIFNPAIERVKQIMDSAEFGQISSMNIRYPQMMPPFEERLDKNKTKMLLDHIFHPGAVIHYLMGKVDRMTYEWEPHKGSTVTTFRFQSGAIGTLHMPGQLSGSSPLEKLEVVGDKANVVVNNGNRVTYYRRADRPAYGRSPMFMVPDEVAPLYWEPEFSLGNLYNKNLFLLGYVQEVLHFCESIRSGTAPVKGTLEQSIEILKIFEVYCTQPAGQQVRLDYNQ